VKNKGGALYRPLQFLLVPRSLAPESQGVHKASMTECSNDSTLDRQAIQGTR